RPRASRVCSVHQHGARARGSSRDDRDAGCAGESPESWEASVKTLYRGALVLWLVSGFAIHAYFSRAAPGTSAVEQQRDLHLRQFENDDAVARQIRESHWNADSKMTLAYAGWALVGFALALRGVHVLFRKADRVADVEKFLAASLVLILLPGCMRQPF